MTDGSSSGGHPNAPGNPPSTGNVPRRMSYASVASGATPQTSSNSLRTGTFTHMATNTPHVSYPTAGNTQYRRYSQEQDSTVSRDKKPPQLPAYSRKYSGLVGSSSRLNNSGGFFTPSYLQESSYVAKLEASWRAQRLNGRDSRHNNQTGIPSVNQSSSSVNVHRIAPSHRGMTYEVIESNPPKDEDILLPLPTRWNEQDKYPGLDVFNDGLDVKYNGSASKSDVEAASVRADYPMSPACGIYYYEVEIKTKVKECAVAVGFSTARSSLERLPGWEPDSWAYHGDDGKTFSGEHNGRSYGQTFSAGDIIGCGINFNTGQAFFTKNGLDLGVAFRELQNKKPFPCIGIKKYSGAVVSVNFGQRPFVFDIDGKVAQEKIAVDTQILKTKTNTLHPKLDQPSLIQELVSQFLMHGGYVETSKAFEEEVKKEKRSLSDLPTSISEQASEIDTTNATIRQQIRRAILSGDIDQALDITNENYPDILERSPEIAFRLKCRKWIELINKAADLRSRQNAANELRRTGKPSNGLSNNPFTPSNVEDVFDQQMELDEEPSTNGTGKAPADFGATNADNDMAYNQLLAQAMDYGQILQRQYPSERDGGHKETLQNIFSLIAYPEPRDSAHGHLLGFNGRVKVAEELNSAILVSLGRPPTAALENTYKQTEALLDILGAEGGAASFVNLRAKFDQR